MQFPAPGVLRYFAGNINDRIIPVRTLTKAYRCDASKRLEERGGSQPTIRSKNFKALMRPLIQFISVAELAPRTWLGDANLKGQSADREGEAQARMG